MSSVEFPADGKKYIKYTDSGAYHLLEFNSPPDNRFTPEFATAFLQAFTWLRSEGEAKPLITTSTSPKFYSNGLDFERAIQTPGFFPNSYYPMMRVLLEFPWPTIALVNGHAFAAGFMVAACHDYIVMNPEKGFLCMNELQFGAPLLPPMMSIFRVKYGTQLAHRIALTAHRFTGQEALKTGLVTQLGGIKEAEAIAAKVTPFAASPTYGAIRIELYREVIDDTRDYESSQDRGDRLATDRDAFYDGIKATLRGKL